MGNDRPRYEEIEIEYLRDGWREVATVEVCVSPDDAPTLTGPPDAWDPGCPGDLQVESVAVWSDKTEASASMEGKALVAWAATHRKAIEDAVRATDGVVW